MVITATLLTITPNSSGAQTIDTVMVTAEGYDLETATSFCLEKAVTKVMKRYVRAQALHTNEERIRFRVLDQSPRYVISSEVILHELRADDYHKLTVKVEVSVDKLLTSLRNLDVEVLMWAPGPDQAIEGRRGAGSRTKPDRFTEEN
tara:strand:+ start:433 stop:873 length:441 start_codon:yes stop_codon:yes gene_type:complete